MSRDAVFDLAVNRALSYAKRFGVVTGASAAKLEQILNPWYLQTRFVYRIPLKAVIKILQAYPGPGVYWSGGEQGTWLKGENPRP
jgi:hypothetical protein